MQLHLERDSDVPLHRQIEQEIRSRIDAGHLRVGDRLLDLGIPIVEPPGGHAIYIDAGRLFPHLPPSDFPGQALAAELYLEGGVRAVEIGSVMFAHPHPETGEMVFPGLELVRLTIPRRVYTQSHVDYLAELLAYVNGMRRRIRGVRIVESPPTLRHFTARLAPAHQTLVSNLNHD